MRRLPWLVGGLLLPALAVADPVVTTEVATEVQVEVPAPAPVLTPPWSMVPTWVATGVPTFGDEGLPDTMPALRRERAVAYAGDLTAPRLPDTMPRLSRSYDDVGELPDVPADEAPTALPVAVVRATTPLTVVVRVEVPTPEPAPPAIDGPDRTGADGRWVRPAPRHRPARREGPPLVA